MWLHPNRHFSIYCRLFLPEALSNSLRNLLEHSTLVALTESATEEAKSVIHKTQEDMTRYYNRRRSLAPVFKPEDQVYLDASDIKTTYPSPKLSHRRLEPFEIECQVGPIAYWLKLPHRLRQLYLVFNVVKLSAAPDNPIPERKPQAPPPPIVINRELE